MCENPERLWTPANDGTGKRTWFLYQSGGLTADDRYYSDTRGRVVRYASYRSASRAARKLNNAMSGWQSVGAGNDS